MISKERNLAINLVYSWSQEHTDKWVIVRDAQSDDAITQVASDLSYVFQTEKVRVDLLSLVDRLELLLRNKMVQGKSSGCKCTRCKQWYDMAIPNQPDGTLLCYTCRTP